MLLLLINKVKTNKKNKKIYLFLADFSLILIL